MDEAADEERRQRYHNDHGQEAAEHPRTL